MIASRLIERYVVKVRYIFEYDKGRDVSDVIIRSLATVQPVLDCDDKRLAKVYQKRNGLQAWTLFYIEGQGRIKGYSFLHIPHQKIEWNDSLPTLIGEARVSTQYVHPDYRGQGVINQVLLSQVNYAKLRSLKVWSVIERANVSSLAASSKVGGVARKNILIKLLGVNIVSVLTNPVKIYILIGSRRARR